MEKSYDKMKDVKLSQKLTESGLLLALGVILSILRIVDLPYGGSITLASLLPLIIISYRYGFKWGMLSGFVYGLIQMVLGLNVFSFVTGIVAVIAVAVLDYILAFMATSLGALYRNMKNPVTAFALAALTVCAVRYAFHVISGCTVWAGLSIPTSDAFWYSLIYNATYMIPETIITVAAAIYISTVLDFSSPRLKANKTEKRPMSVHILNAVSGFLLVAAVVAIVAMVFSKLQNAETGEFDVTGISTVDTTALIIVAAAAVILICALQIVKASVGRQQDSQQNEE